MHFKHAVRALTTPSKSDLPGQINRLSFPRNIKALSLSLSLRNQIKSGFGSLTERTNLRWASYEIPPLSRIIFISELSSLSLSLSLRWLNRAFHLSGPSCKVSYFFYVNFNMLSRNSWWLHLMFTRHFWYVFSEDQNLLRLAVGAKAEHFGFATLFSLYWSICYIIASV